MNYIIVPATMRVNKDVSLMFNLLTFLSLLGAPAKVRKALVMSVRLSALNNSQPTGNSKTI